MQGILQRTTGALPGDLTIYTGNLQSVLVTPNASADGSVDSISRMITRGAEGRN